MMLTSKEKKVSVVFFIIVLAELLCGSIESLSQYRYVTKPAIVISLLIFFWTESRTVSKSVRNLTLLALLFSLLGDVLLQFVDRAPHYFMLGLVAFLVTHIFYIFVFLNRRNPSKKPIALVVLLALYAIGIMTLLKNGLGDLALPVLMYIIVIMTMAIMAFLREGNVSKTSYTWVILGAVLFLISDSLLAIHTFYESFTFGTVFIMLTYSLAQYFIVLGIKKQS